MRCDIMTAASRWTWARCSRSSTRLILSLNCTLNSDKGSRDKGAPALAASRCQAKASATWNLGAASKACALSTHSWAKDSCALRRLSSSSFSRKGLAAPLSLALISL